MITNLPLLIVVGSTIVNLGLIVLIFIHSQNRQSKKYFTAMTLGIIGWIISNYLSNFIKDYQIAILSNKLIFLTTTFAAWAFLLFTEVFPEDRKPDKKLFLITSTLMVITVGIALSSYLVQGITIKENISEISFGWGIHLYTVFLLGCLISALTKLVKKYRRAKDVTTKNTLRLLFGGMGIFLIFSIITNLFFPLVFEEFELTNLAPFYTVIFISVITFAILRYGFLNIKVILTETLVGLIALILFIQAFTVPTFWWKVFGFFILFLFSLVGYFLIKSVLREIELRAELQNAYEELKRLDKAKSEFISIASHQLRTPLTAIKGYISMIIEGSYGKMSEKTKEPMENVYKSNERLIKLVNDLLSISRIESGRMEINLEKFSLEDIISSVVNESKIEAGKKGLKLTWEKPPEPLPKISADRDKIRQVILNVIDNGVRYTRKGGITIRARSGEESLLIKVSDTGVGLTKEEISYLFESFSRGKAGTRFWSEGVGLGLYVAKKFIELQNGKIWAESKGKGKGSTFYIELPIK